MPFNCVFKLLIHRINVSSGSPAVRPNSLQLATNSNAGLGLLGGAVADQDQDFFTKQARLQIEARMALAQAKDMAHMQMEVRIE